MLAQPKRDWLAEVFCRSYVAPVDTLPGGYLVAYLEAVQRLRPQEVPSEGGERLKLAPGQLDYCVGVIKINSNAWR